MSNDVCHGQWDIRANLFEQEETETTEKSKDLYFPAISAPSSSNSRPQKSFAAQCWFTAVSGTAAELHLRRLVHTVQNTTHIFRAADRCIDFTNAPFTRNGGILFLSASPGLGTWHDACPRLAKGNIWLRQLISK
jgi:hypothetical protein